MQDSSTTIFQNQSETNSVSSEHDSLVTSAKKTVEPILKTNSVSKNDLQNSASGISSLSKQDVITLTSSSEKKTSQNFYGSHELKVIHNGPQLLERNTPDWIFPLLVLILAAFAWLRAYYNKYFMQIFTAFFNNNLTNQIVRDENILLQRASVLLNIVFNLVAALFLYLISIHFNWFLFGIGTGFSRYIFFTIIVSAVYTIKFLILKICGFLFKVDKEMSAYIFNIFLINNVLGILLIPMVVLLVFSVSINATGIIYFSLILAVLAFFYRLARGLSVGVASPVASLYYLFLYLCALEFAPLVVLIKILIRK